MDLRTKLERVIAGLKEDARTSNHAAERLEKGTVACGLMNGFAGGLEHAIEELERLLAGSPQPAPNSGYWCVQCRDRPRVSGRTRCEHCERFDSLSPAEFRAWLVSEIAARSSRSVRAAAAE